MRARCRRSYIRRHDRHSRRRASGEPTVSGVDANLRPGVQPVSLAGRDRRHAQPASHAAGQRPRAGRRDRCWNRAERRALPRRARRTRPHRARRGDAAKAHAHACSEQGASRRFVDAPAERLPFADASVDTVVSTLVLCTVPDPERTLGEIARVLRPDGQLLFVEHVRAKLAVPRGVPGLPVPSVARLRRRVLLQSPDRRTNARLRGFVVAADDSVWRACLPSSIRSSSGGRLGDHRNLDVGCERRRAARISG